MHQYMSHTLNNIPFNLGMCVFKFLGQHINSLPYDFNMLHKTIKKDGIFR